MPKNHQTFHPPCCLGLPAPAFHAGLVDAPASPQAPLVAATFPHAGGAAAGEPAPPGLAPHAPPAVGEAPQAGIPVPFGDEFQPGGGDG